VGVRPVVVLDVFALATDTDDANRPTILSVGGALLTSKRAGASRLRWIQPSTTLADLFTLLFAANPFSAGIAAAVVER
jgi:hypothetical protein